VLVASAGGYDAVAKVLAGVGRRSPHAFVVTIKASDGPSMLFETLELSTSMRLVTVQDDARLEPGSVYLARPGEQLVFDNMNVVSEPRTQGACSICTTLESAVKAWGEQTTAVVLSGGSAPIRDGVRAVLDAGGRIYCQSPSTAAIDEMPVSVLREVGASGVGSVGEISTWIREGLPPELRDTGEPDRFAGSLPPAFWTLLEALRVTTDFDLYAYRTATLYRRVAQRARTLGCDDVDAYVERALEDDDELRALGSRLLIGTTDFFRNEALYDDLRNVVVSAVREQPTFAVWCAGCSTGEEAYSVAALLHAELEASGSKTRLHLLATDVRPDAIEFASAGVYPLSRVQNLPASLRERYGRSEGGRWSVGDVLRSCVSFSVHDVLSDPPPRDRDLVLFRNVMIYLRPDVHPHALAQMHEALRPGGFLTVGESESTHSLEGAFARHSPGGAILHRV